MRTPLGFVFVARMAYLSHQHDIYRYMYSLAFITVVGLLLTIGMFSNVINCQKYNDQTENYSPNVIF